MRKQTFNVLETCSENVLLKKKLAEAIKMLSTGEKQQFKFTNKLVDDLISRLQNFKAFNSFKASTSTETEKHNKQYYEKNFVKI